MAQKMMHCVPSIPERVQLWMVLTPWTAVLNLGLTQLKPAAQHLEDFWGSGFAARERSWVLAGSLLGH